MAACGVRAALTKGLNQLGEIANASGMRLCYHHHVSTGVDPLMAATDPALVHLLLDWGHLAFAGDHPLAAGRTARDRIKHVHLKSLCVEIGGQVRDENLSFQDPSRLACSPSPATAQLRRKMRRL